MGTDVQWKAVTDRKWAYRISNLSRIVGDPRCVEVGQCSFSSYADLISIKPGEYAVLSGTIVAAGLGAGVAMHNRSKFPIRTSDLGGYVTRIMSEITPADESVRMMASSAIGFGRGATGRSDRQDVKHDYLVFIALEGPMLMELQHTASKSSMRFEVEIGKVYILRKFHKVSYTLHVTKKLFPVLFRADFAFIRNNLVVEVDAVDNAFDKAVSVGYMTPIEPSRLRVPVPPAPEKKQWSETEIGEWLDRDVEEGESEEEYQPGIEVSETEDEEVELPSPRITRSRKRKGEGKDWDRRLLAEAGLYVNNSRTLLSTV